MTITLTREEAQQVLDALASCSGVSHWPSLMPVIKTLRARLAQPEPEPVAWDNCVAGLAEARLCKSWCGNFNCSATEPQREWQGLTDEEIMSLLPGAVRLPPGWSETARAIEAKLTEKNASHL